MLFSDLSNYTALSERLDPEQIKELMIRILQAVTPVIEKFDGRLEQILGDGIMVLFGADKSHEDDALRALKVARGIHRRVKRISGEQESILTVPLSMHTGISSGLVVTGRIDRFAGRHGVSGDTVNLASRLADLARADEILVDEATFRSTRSTSRFEVSTHRRIRGKAEPVLLYRFLGPRSGGGQDQNRSGRDHPMIGRQSELRKLHQAFERMIQGATTVVSVTGEAGSGKSRLVREFKTGLPRDGFQWYETVAYPHSSNMPYSLMTALFRNIFKIDAEKSKARIHRELAAQINGLAEMDFEMIPLLAGFKSLGAYAAQSMNPEFWLRRAHAATVSLSSALAARKPTVFYLEDLQWADGPSLKMIRTVLPDVSHPLFVLCAYRPRIRHGGGPGNPIAAGALELELA